jgi:hypothetical protein
LEEPRLLPALVRAPLEGAHKRRLDRAR